MQRHAADVNARAGNFRRGDFPDKRNQLGQAEVFPQHRSKKNKNLSLNARRQHAVFGNESELRKRYFAKPPRKQPERIFLRGNAAGNGRKPLQNGLLRDFGKTPFEQRRAVGFADQTAAVRQIIIDHFPQLLGRNSGACRPKKL